MELIGRDLNWEEKQHIEKDGGLNVKLDGPKRPNNHTKKKKHTYP